MTPDEGIVFLQGTFQPGVKKYASDLSITQAELDDLDLDLLWYAFAQNRVLYYTEERTKAVAYRELLLNRNKKNNEVYTPKPDAEPKKPEKPVTPGIEDRINLLIQRIKNSKGYNDAIGKELGIDWDSTFTKDTKPNIISLKQVAEGVEIRWNKAGKNNSVAYFESCDTNNAADLAHFTTVGSAKFVDKRPLPDGVTSQVRMYRYAFMVGDSPSQIFSEPLAITISVLGDGSAKGKVVRSNRFKSSTLSGFANGNDVPTASNKKGSKTPPNE